MSEHSFHNIGRVVFQLFSKLLRPMEKGLHPALTIRPKEAILVEDKCIPQQVREILQAKKGSC